MSGDTTTISSLEKGQQINNELKKLNKTLNDINNKMSKEYYKNDMYKDIRKELNPVKKTGGYLERTHKIHGNDLAIRLLSFIDNVIENSANPNNKSLLDIENIYKMLEDFIASDGFDPQIIEAIKETKSNDPQNRFYIRVDNKPAFKCHLNNLAVFINCRLNGEIPEQIEMHDLEELNGKSLLNPQIKNNVNTLVNKTFDTLQKPTSYWK
jgi:hypothetical protein